MTSEAVGSEDPGEGRAKRGGLARRMALAVVAPAAIGAVTGAAVAALTYGVEDRALDAVAALPGAIPALLTMLALPLSMLMAIAVTRTLRPSTSELYVVTHNTPGALIPVRQIPGRILAAIATVGLGGSQGMESPSAIIGATLGQWLGRLRAFTLDEDEKRSLLSAGAGAGIAAVFSSPGVGALYGIEVPYRRDADLPRLVPAIIAAGCSYVVHSSLAGARALVHHPGTPGFDLRFLLGVVLLGLSCGVGARLFAAALTGLRDLAKHGSPWLRAGAAALALGALAYTGHALTGTWITFGPGYIAAGWLETSQHALPLLLVAMLVRTAGTLTSVYGGGGGGVFTSLACTGVFIGEAIAQTLQIEAGRAFPLLGAACFLGVGYRIPVAGMLLVAEQSGEPMLVAAGLGAIAIALAVMGDSSVSDAQVDHRS